MSAPHLSVDERFMVCLDHGKTVRTVAVGCRGCGKFVSKPYRHDASDAEIARRCFSGWKIKNVRGAKRTLCPKCISKGR